MAATVSPNAGLPATPSMLVNVPRRRDLFPALYFALKSEI